LSAGFFLWVSGKAAIKTGHSDSVFGGTKILTPSGPRCGLKRVAFNQA